MAENFGVHEFQSFVDVFGGPVVRLNIERFDESAKLAGGLVEHNVHVVHVECLIFGLIVG